MVSPGVSIYVDNMENEASISYGAYPERLYIILDGNVKYQGGMGPFFYSLNEMEHWLEQYHKSVDESNNNTMSLTCIP